MSIYNARKLQTIGFYHKNSDIRIMDYIIGTLPFKSNQAVHAHMIGNYFINKHMIKLHEYAGTVNVNSYRSYYMCNGTDVAILFTSERKRRRIKLLQSRKDETFSISSTNINAMSRLRDIKEIQSKAK